MLLEIGTKEHYFFLSKSERACWGIFAHLTDVVNESKYGILGLLWHSGIFFFTTTNEK